MGKSTMSPSDDDGSSSAQPGVANAGSHPVSRCFYDLLDSIIVDVASECHRIARLGLDRHLEEGEEEQEELRQSAEANMEDPGADFDVEEAVDIFGETHPAVACEVIECMNCGQRVAAGGFAPHLKECMTKSGSQVENNAQPPQAATPPLSSNEPRSVLPGFS